MDNGGHDLGMTIGVVGLGAMGSGIAEVFARTGYAVIGIENDEAALDRGRGILRKSTDRAVAKGKLDGAAQQALLDRITFSTDLADVAPCGLIIEAVSERLELKTSIFERLDQLAAPDAILATNTSSLSITEIASATTTPGRIIGVHFFNPAPIQPLVEVIHTVSTDPAVPARVLKIMDSVGKSPIACGDRAGFIVNSLLIGYLNRAVRLYEKGFAGRDEMDQAMVESAGYPMGPLTLLDLVGLDVSLAVTERLYDESKDRVLAPAPLLRQLVAAKFFGQKTGRGFYTYGPDGITDAPGPALPGRTNRLGELPDALVVPYLNAALTMVQTNYATPAEIDTGMSLGCRMPKPFDVLAELGPAHVLKVQQQVFAETAEPGYRPSLLLEQLAAAPDPAAALAQLRA